MCTPHLLVLSDPYLPREQDASGGEMQSAAVHLVTRSPAPQEGPTRPDEYTSVFAGYYLVSGATYEIVNILPCFWCYLRNRKYITLFLVLLTRS